MIPKEIPPVPPKKELSQEFQKIPHSAFCADSLATKSLEHLGPHSRAGNEVVPFLPSMLPEGVGTFFKNPSCTFDALRILCKLFHIHIVVLDKIFKAYPHFLVRKSKRSVQRSSGCHDVVMHICNVKWNHSNGNWPHLFHQLCIHQDSAYAKKQSKFICHWYFTNIHRIFVSKTNHTF